MKKLFVLCLTILTLMGCQKEKTGGNIQKTIEDAGYKVLFAFSTFPYDDLYDSKGTCYNIDGVKKTCSRINEVPSGFISIYLFDKEQKRFSIISEEDDSTI